MTRDELVAALTLNKTPEHWWFTWNMSRGRVAAEDVAGSFSYAYWRIRYNGKDYRAHHLVWLHETGVWPTRLIDHINGNSIDNRFTNLREVTHLQNSQNRLAQKDSITGVKGVSLNPSGSFKAKIQACNTSICLGSYGTIGEAARAYLTAAQQHHDTVAVERYQTAYAHILNNKEYPQ